jgi:hypothetical protein
VSPAAPQGVRTDAPQGAGISFNVPRNWRTLASRPPLLDTVASGAAVVAVWRYRRSAPAPADRQALRLARRRLVAAARLRDPTMQLIRTRFKRIDGAATIELDTTELIANQLRRVRSLHLYIPGAEIVLEEYAPPDLFTSVNKHVFSLLNRSLRLLPAARS